MEQRNPIVSIAGTIGALTLGMIALIVIFAPSYAWVCIFVTLLMVVLGIILGHYATRKKK
jgi:hypothetical protein